MVDKLAELVGVTVPALREIADALAEGLGEVAEKRPFVDMVDRLAVNREPDHPYITARMWSWWPLREAAEVTGITIHHTLSHSPEATAAYCARPQREGGKGYPSIQYHFWVSAADGCRCYRCAPVEWALWHDHTGAWPTTISVGMAGRLHAGWPAGEQVEAAARLVAWLMGEYEVPLEEVRGHNDRYQGTICPGWDVAGWRDVFFEELMKATR